MVCPYCEKDKDRVIDSRSSDGGLVVRRRRECLSCNRRYTTYERVEKTSRLVVIKKDGSRVPFEIQNVVQGLQAACGKRPVPEEVKQRLAREVEEQLHRDFDREVPSDRIGQLVAGKLREIDEIAYIRYASEYYEFGTLGECAAELSELRAHTKDGPNQQGLFQD